MKNLRLFTTAIAVGIILSSCSSNESDKQTNSASQNIPEATFSLKNLIEENKYSPDSMCFRSLFVAHLKPPLLKT